MSNDLAVNIENANVLLDGKEILHNISWQVKRGEKCFILGANGAGKTTLVKTILGYIWPLYGAKVEVLGNLYGEVNLTQLRKSIAWVSPFIQQHLDPTLTGLDMVLSSQDGYLGFYRKATDEELEKAEKLLTNLNALHLANKSICGMSSGQQMKILIARALLTKSELMI
ncbi:MAG: ATP-binding cassette domain-containing protein [Candidatus Gastranaerophilales bacterium]|nr:ATP-binding cassette domain-containing protein [Candidatus Gastranaerophilales bacterium]